MIIKSALSGKFCLLLMILLYLVSSPVMAQENTSVKSYLGQNPPGMEPEMFAPEVVSSSEGIEWACTFTLDGRECYFTRWDGSSNPTKIFYTIFENNILTEPAIAPFCGEGYNEMEPFITYDGQKLFFSSSRPLNGVSGVDHIWVVDRTADGWSEPYALGSPINDGNSMYMTLSREGTAYYTSSSNEGDIYMSKYSNGEFSTPVRLESPINTQYTDAHPFIAADESYLIFDSWRPGGHGRCNLYICFKENTGEWSTPIQLDERINRGDVTSMAMVTQDGKYFFFSSDNDIYWVDARILRESAPVDLEASSLKIKPKKPIPRGGSIKLQGKVSNSSDVYSTTTELIFYLSVKKKINKKSILLGTATFESLQPGKSRKIKLNSSIPKNIKPKSYYIIFNIDGVDINLDPDRSNNIVISDKKVNII